MSTPDTESTIHLVNYVEDRNELVAWLRRQLMGPADEESLRLSPLDRYPTGVLHPIDPGRSGMDPALAGTEEGEGDLLDDQDDRAPSDGTPDDQPVAQPARRRRYVPPSSVGFSFFVRGNVCLSIAPSAAVYQDRNPERGERGRFQSPLYERSELPECAVTWTRSAAASNETSDPIWEGRAGIYTRARPHRGGLIVTVTLANRVELDATAWGRDRTRDRAEKSLFEARLECVIESGELVDYPRVDPSLLTEEEQELELQYRQQRIYAVGHGAAADWELKRGRPARIWSDFMPEAEVPLITVETLGEENVLSLVRLAAAAKPDELEHFVDRYADWVAEQIRVASAFPNGKERAPRIAAGDLMADEYRALAERIPDLREDEDFVTEHHTDEWSDLRDGLDGGDPRRIASTVSRLIAVNRLKEVMVLKGFQRVGGRVTPPDLTGESDWLPALELYGEGIFLTLDEAMLQRWEAGVALQRRAEAFAQRYDHRNGQATPEGHVEVSPRFLLCHTLAHLIIRRLDAEAGYPAAALKERIYSRTGKAPMAGILIYVTVADQEGSLGGLMEMAEPERFLRLLTTAFEAASWCSMDPVCAEQDGHGPDLLNRAACHACALVPEPSCPIGNVLLDRAFVTGAAPDIAPLTDHAESTV